MQNGSGMELSRTQIGSTRWLLAVFLLATVAPALATYDLNADWGDGSGTNNPNGQWSLRYGSNLLPLHYWFGSESKWLWDWSGSTVPSFASETLTKWNDCLPGDIVMQGAYNASDPHANILWTAPRNGTINIRGRTWDAYGGRPGAWTLYVGGSQVAGGSIAASSKRTSVGVTFAENILPGQSITKVPVDAGTQIVFNQDNGTVGVEMTISYWATISGQDFGVGSNGFGFTITGDSNQVTVAEACTNLSSGIWSPLATNTLTGGSFYFSEPQWTNYPTRFYRVQSP